MNVMACLCFIRVAMSGEEAFLRRQQMSMVSFGRSEATRDRSDGVRVHLLHIWQCMFNVSVCHVLRRDIYLCSGHVCCTTRSRCCTIHHVQCLRFCQAHDVQNGCGCTSKRCEKTENRVQSHTVAGECWCMCKQRMTPLAVLQVWLRSHSSCSMCAALLVLPFRACCCGCCARIWLVVVRWTMSWKVKQPKNARNSAQ